MRSPPRALGRNDSVFIFEAERGPRAAYYNAFFKIGLEAKESNTLSQMRAWAVSDDASPLKTPLQAFFDDASSR